MKFSSRFRWSEVTAKTSDVRSGHTSNFFRKPRPDLIASFTRALIWCIYHLCNCNGFDFMERLIKSLQRLVFENIAAMALWTLWRFFGQSFSWYRPFNTFFEIWYFYWLFQSSFSCWFQRYQKFFSRIKIAWFTDV